MGGRRLFALTMALAGLASVLTGSSVAAQEAPRLRPDALVRRASEATPRGGDVYNRTGTHQSRYASVSRGETANFIVRVENDGTTRGDVRVRGTSESSAFAVRYYLGEQSVSPPVKAGTFVLAGIAPGGHWALRIEIEPTRQARPRDQRSVFVVTTSVTDGSVVDAVRADVRVPLYTADQQRVAELVNDTRAAHGLRGLTLNRTLAKKAQGWAEHLAAIGHLEHSDLTAGVPSGWAALGENVGYLTTIAEVHQEFMGSSGHRANILGHWTNIGTGVARRGQWVYVVQEFMLT
jgi:uncharacterized protein YkwD